jgi:hypothetical protein
MDEAVASHLGRQRDQTLCRMADLEPLTSEGITGISEKLAEEMFGVKQ